MANQKPTKTSFTKTNQPTTRKPRGKSERTKILEAMKRRGKTETGFYNELVDRAFNADDSFTFKEVLTRLSPIPKAVAPLVNFKLNKKDDPHVQASDVLLAISNGDIPADIGATIITGITNMLKIKEVTDIDERLKAMEEKIDAHE